MAPFSLVGIPKDLLTNQRTPFISKLMLDLCQLLQVNHLKTSVCHLQTDRLIKRLNQMLKRLLKQVVNEEGRNWDLLLPYLLLAIWETSKASTGFTLFELLY